MQKTVWTFPAVAIRELQRFRPDIQHRQLIGGILVSRFVDRHRLPRSRCRELFGQMLLQFRFQFQFQRSESFGTALPALCCPWVAVPPEPPDLRFVQPIIVHQRRCLITSSVSSRKIPHSAAIAGVQTHPVQPQRGTKSNIQRILLLHLAFFRSGQRAGAFAVFGQAPFFPYRPAVLPAAPLSQSPRPIPAGTGRGPGSATGDHSIQIPCPDAVPRLGRFPSASPSNFFAKQTFQRRCWCFMTLVPFRFSSF